MRRAQIEILEDDVDDAPAMTRAELGIPIDLTREDLEDDDDLGLRALYEHPEAILGAGWPRAA
ncbi:MAG: hypothetical protein JST00_18285 [Deltaproteobacteria bacterium]|nr:hypothetical protein [Deltaproteobacteria bacterium]